MTKDQFKKLILAQVFVLIAYIVTSFFTTALLPAELQSFVEASMERDLTTPDIIIIVLALPFLAWVVYNLRALYAFKSHAPKHLLYITLLSGVFYLNIFEPLVFTNIDAFFNDVLYLLNGFTLGIVYFSNIANEFKKPEVVPVVAQ